MSSNCRRAGLLLLGCLLAVPSRAYGQSEVSSPTWQIREGLNEISLYERFSMFIEHSARIRRVMDFDDEVITVQTVDGHPNQFRIYALKSGVTTITIVDEFDQNYSIEVLVRGDVRHLESFIRRLYPNDSVIVEEISDSAVRLDGWVTRPENVSEIQAIASEFYPNVLNHMKTGGVQQVLLKCTVLEVQRTKLRRLGMNFTLIRPDGFLTSTPGPITPISSLTGSGSGTAMDLSGFQNTSIAFGLTRPNSVFQGFIQAMREEGLLKSHATPMVVTHNGRPANFLSGGETPIPVSGGLGTSGIQFKEFGIQMNAVPYILGNGRVRLEVEAIVRDRDTANSVTINGTTTTAFKTNSANTQVEMNFGEALVIAGLVAQREIGLTQKLPVLGELPVIGSAFSRKSYEESETELIILVTPEYVAPMDSSQLPSPGPGQFTDQPVDRELFFQGLLEVPKFGDECDICPNCVSGDGPCLNPNCRHCRPGQSSCVPAGSAKYSPDASSQFPRGEAEPEILPDAKKSVNSIPASATREAGSTPEASQQRKTNSTRSAGSGLITPAMR